MRERVKNPNQDAQDTQITWNYNEISLLTMLSKLLHCYCILTQEIQNFI
jgi:hypothetical protein